MKNKINQEIRDKIIFKNSTPEYSGGTASYEGLTVSELEMLIEKGYAALDEQQNKAPNIGEILEFMRKYPQVTAHGYVVSFNRSDVRVSIEGIECLSDMTPEFITDFINTFRYADDFMLTQERAYCWFD